MSKHTPHRAYLRKKGALLMRKEEALRKIRYYSSAIFGSLLASLLLYWFLYQLFGFGIVTVDQTTALHGHATGYNEERQYLRWYLNGTSKRYDLWAFEPGDLATKQLIAADSAVYIRRYGFPDATELHKLNKLSRYLRVGARIEKAANSPYITVEQAHRLTRWRYRPSESALVEKRARLPALHP